MAAVEVNPDYEMVSEAMVCIKADIIEADSDERLLAMTKTDDRGPFWLLDFGGELTPFIEVVHSMPGAIRANHVHKRCTEKLTVIAGKVTLYLLCDCEGQHVRKIPMRAGATAIIYPHIAHAVVSEGESELVVGFGNGDPRVDRHKVSLVA